MQYIHEEQQWNAESATLQEAELEHLNTLDWSEIESITRPE